MFSKLFIFASLFVAFASIATASPTLWTRSDSTKTSSSNEGKTCNPNFEGASISLLKDGFETDFVLIQQTGNAGEPLYIFKNPANPNEAFELRDGEIQPAATDASNPNQLFFVECQKCSSGAASMEELVGKKCLVKTSKEKNCVSFDTSSTGLFVETCDGSADQYVDFESADPKAKN